MRKAKKAALRMEKKLFNKAKERKGQLRFQFGGRVSNNLHLGGIGKELIS